MPASRVFTTSAALLAALFLVFPGEAHAYLDPGTGSYITQMLFASFMGALFMIKVFWARIRLFFSRLLKREKTPEAERANVD